MDAEDGHCTLRFHGTAASEACKEHSRCDHEQLKDCHVYITDLSQTVNITNRTMAAGPLVVM